MSPQSLIAAHHLPQIHLLHQDLQSDGLKSYHTVMWPASELNEARQGDQDVLMVVSL